VQARRGEIRQHTLPRAFRTDLFSVRPPAIECHRALASSMTTSY
jgi:hypothetical protein